MMNIIQTPKLSVHSGFTLIELIIVIFILGILAVTAASRFINISDDANKSVVKSTVSSFDAGVKLIHYKWTISGNGPAQQNFIPISDPDVGCDLSVNSSGFPADTRGTSLTLSRRDDCLDAFRAVLATDMSVDFNDESDFQC
ncbi:MAG: prepilin-type N-terminal cleavage/methylation domain-containing protein [Alphaproteobacteria bacterium]|jgi:prepilin-type N-terminal cleavage/methylation domain-containing protein